MTTRAKEELNVLYKYMAITTPDQENGLQLIEHIKADHAAKKLSPNRAVRNPTALRSTLKLSHSTVYVNWMMTNYYV